MTAVALEVDLVSINEFDDSVITALMDPYLFRAVPALIQRLHARMLVTVFIGSLHIVLNSGMHPNHFIHLIPIVQNMEPLVIKLDYGGPLCNVTPRSSFVCGNGLQVNLELRNTPVDLIIGDSSQAHVESNISMNVQTDRNCLVEIKTWERRINVNMEDTAVLKVETKGHRNYQQVVSNAGRLTVANWMILQESLGLANILSKAILQFPHIFRQKNPEKNLF